MATTDKRMREAAIQMMSSADAAALKRKLEHVDANREAYDRRWGKRYMADYHRILTDAITTATKGE